jgi:hypothetical protein
MLIPTCRLSWPVPAALPAQIIEQHRAFLRRLMKGCLLSRKVVVLRCLLALKETALKFVKVADGAVSLPWDKLDDDVEARFAGAGEHPGGCAGTAETRGGREGARQLGGQAGFARLRPCHGPAPERPSAVVCAFCVPNPKHG